VQLGELKQRGRVWWIRYYRNGQRFEESSGSTKKGAAIDLLKIREGDGAHGLPVTPKMGRLRFEEAAADVLNDYRTNGKRSVDEVERRIAKHLQPFFGGRRMTAITTAEVRAYIASRQGEREQVRRTYETKRKDGTIRRVPEQRRAIAGVSNGEINRELTILKRIFSLAMQAGKLLHKPHIPCCAKTMCEAGSSSLRRSPACRRTYPRHCARWWSLPTSRAGASPVRSCRSNGAAWTSPPATYGSTLARRKTGRAASSR
jgi:hypothetical protein